ncbi:hypothetical protein Tco_0348830 [Tanacetum coccineum]
MVDTVKDTTEVIEKLERYPHLCANLEASETARLLKRVQQRDMEKDGMLGQSFGARGCVVCHLGFGF